MVLELVAGHRRPAAGVVARQRASQPAEPQWRLDVVVDVPQVHRSERAVRLTPRRREQSVQVTSWDELVVGVLRARVAPQAVGVPVVLAACRDEARRQLLRRQVA